ncbi:MAG: hypothetical protein KJZ47_06910 [Gemmatimonadales bacterium]|nr:hypothetical protein [Gemmatimonadales bacterium]
MDRHTVRLLTVVTESVLEGTLTRDLERLGAHGYTITNARGKGTRGVRDAGWEASSNIRVEVLCDAATSEVLVAHLRERYYEDYAMVLFVQDVEVLRPGKF